MTLRCHPFINKFCSIESSCHAVVERKASKQFAGEWVSLLSGVRLYMLSGHWIDKFQDLVLLDKDGNRRPTYKDMVKADNGATMCCATWSSPLKIPISYMLDFTTKAGGLVRSMGSLTTGKDSPSLRMVKDQPERAAWNDA